MKIIYIYDSIARIGGVERILTEKINYLSELNDITLITSSQGKHPLSFYINKDIKHIDIDVRFHKQYKYKFPIKLFINYYYNFLFRKRIKKLIDEIKPDIIIATTYYKASAICKIKTNAKIIIESHCAKDYTGENDGIKRNWIINKLNSYIVRYNNYIIEKYSSAIVSLSKEDSLCWENTNKSFCIPNFIPNYFLKDNIPLNNYKKERVISVGRLVYQKGFDRLIRIWSIVNKQYPTWKLDIYGEGEKEDELKRKIQEYSLEKVITIKPFTKDIMTEYTKSSIFALTSNYEGFGLVLIEAMFCGLPCISFNCPFGPSEIIKNNEDGIIVTNNDIELYADKLCGLIKSQQLRMKLGENAKTNVLRYSPKYIIDKWNELFKIISV